MKMCWNLEPTDRPTFNKISQMIDRILGGQDEQEKVSWREILSEIQGCAQNIPWTERWASLLYRTWQRSLNFHQLLYRNVHPEQLAEGEGCDEPKCYDRPCEQSCDHEEEEEPLMKTNNYQFCWVRPMTSKPVRPANKQRDSWIGRGTTACHTAGQLQLFPFFSFFFSHLPTRHPSYHGKHVTCSFVDRDCDSHTWTQKEDTQRRITGLQSYLPLDISHSSSTYRFTVIFRLKGECSRLYYKLSPNVLLVLTFHPFPLHYFVTRTIPAKKAASSRALNKLVFILRWP